MRRRSKHFVVHESSGGRKNVSVGRIELGRLEQTVLRRRRKREMNYIQVVHVSLTKKQPSTHFVQCNFLF